MRVDTIPQEMRELNQWVVARSGSKVPLRADGRGAASSCDPNTWTSFTEAAKAVESKTADYLGFVFADCGIVGIDIDAGFEPSGLLSTLGTDIMRACKSFTEKSRSGRGVHIYVRGTLPFKGKNNGSGVEIYRTGRYFIVTGEKLVYEALAANQEGIDYVVERYFPEMLKVSDRKVGGAIYVPQYEIPADGSKIPLRAAVYPEIPQGSRNISLASLAGQLHTKGYAQDAIFAELMKCNIAACKPPLSPMEVGAIVESITRYQR